MLFIDNFRQEVQEFNLKMQKYADENMILKQQIETANVAIVEFNLKVNNFQKDQGTLQTKYDEEM